MQTVTNDIRFIGVDDDNLDLFEGQYPIPQGVSYNSYLIDDESAAIIDTVDMRRCHDWLAKVDHALAGRSPRYIVVQHMEPDHSGSLAALLARYPEITVVATAKALAMMANFFEGLDLEKRHIAVTEGDTLSLGKTTLRFFTAPMVHWPEVMMTLDLTHGVLFSADAFGTFAMSGATEGWDAEARRYYCNIVGKYGPSVQGIMKKLAGQPFSTVAPLHGPVLKENLAHYWTLYDKWSRYEPERKGVLVAYASVYGGTAEAARRLGAMLLQHGVAEVVLADLCRHDVSQVVAEAFRLSHMALCSVTYDGGLFPAMHNFLHHIASKNLRNRTVALVENGSWAPTAAKAMRDMLAPMKGFEIIEPAVTIRSRMHAADLNALDTLAAALASTL